MSDTNTTNGTTVNRVADAEQKAAAKAAEKAAKAAAKGASGLFAHMRDHGTERKYPVRKVVDGVTFTVTLAGIPRAASYTAVRELAADGGAKVKGKGGIDDANDMVGMPSCEYTPKGAVQFLDMLRDA